MKPDERPHDPVEQAALYAAGALPPDEVAAVEARLDTGDEVLASELSSYDALLGSLLGEADPVEPDPASKAAILRRVTGSTGAVEAKADRRPSGPGEAEEVLICRARPGGWQECGVPGIQFRLLHRDTGRKMQTGLIRMAPGTVLPEHPHPGVEECYVLEGDISTMGTVLTSGDYVRFPAGSSHGRSRTEGGCLIFLTSGIEADPDRAAPRD
jgi:anti-sigma factor ChrR (cupin superfamily)